MDSMLFDAIADSDANGVVISSEQGINGNLLLQRVALDKEIPVVLVSCALPCNVWRSYNYLGGGKQLHEAGVIFLRLSGQKARVKLSVLLSAHANSRETIAGAFQV